MFSWARKHTHLQQLIGLELHAEGIALVSKTFDQGAPTLNKIAFLAGAEQEQIQHLQAYVATHKLKNIACNLVLPGSAYQLFLLEAPEVPEEELREAIRWRLKDLVTLSMDKVAIDLFLLPRDINRSGKKMVYVVVTNRDYLLGVIDKIANTGLKLKSIDIAELALRNLAISLVDPQFDSRGVAIARIKRGSGSISVFRGGSLYLSRQFDLPYDGGLLDDLPVETLALELQRSLDYYERQLGQALPSVIFVGGENVQEDKLSATLRASLNTPIQHLDFSGAIKIVAEVDSGIMQMCLAAAGAALRQEFA